MCWEVKKLDISDRRRDVFAAVLRDPANTAENRLPAFRCVWFWLSGYARAGSGIAPSWTSIPNVSQVVHSSTTFPPSKREIVSPETVTSFPVCGDSCELARVRSATRPAGGDLLALGDLLVDRDRAAGEACDVSLDVLPRSRWTANRLGYGRIVADVIRRDELVDPLRSSPSHGSSNSRLTMFLAFSIGAPYRFVCAGEARSPRELPQRLRQPRVRLQSLRRCGSAC